MKKWVLTMCTVLAALGAFMTPATASAAPVLTENGTKLAVGAKITATNDGSAKFSGAFGAAECTSFWTTSTLVTNDSTKGIKATVENGGASGCTSNIGAMDLTFPKATNEGGTRHLCIQTVAGEDKGEMLPFGCNSEEAGEMTILANFTESGLKCPYKRSAGISGSFTTNSAPATLKLGGEPEFLKEEGSILCPASVKITQIAFNIYTDNVEETPLSIS